MPTKEQDKSANMQGAEYIGSLTQLKEAIEERQRMMQEVSKNKILHPVRHKYTLGSIQMLLVEKHVLDAIASQSSGIAIYGNQRIGKTTCIRVLESKLRSGSCGDMVVLHTELPPGGFPREKGFIDHLYRDFRIERPKGRVTNAEDKINLITRLIQMAYDQGGKLVLFIDEAQWLGTKEYEYMLHLQNRVTKGGVDFTAVLVGNHRLRSQIDALRHEKEVQITDRFMKKIVRMTGLTSEAEIKYFLAMYDETTTYNGKTFTEYYFPEGAQERILVDEYETIKSLLCEITGCSQLPELLMVDFVDVVNNMFELSGIHGRKAFWPERNDWAQAIVGSNIIDSVLNMALESDQENDEFFMPANRNIRKGATKCLQ